jgi:hypothetical protein
MVTPTSNGAELYNVSVAAAQIVPVELLLLNVADE